MADLVIKSVFRAVDKVSGVTKKIGANVTAFSNKAGKRMQKLASGIKSVGRGFANFARTGAIVVGAGAAIGAALFGINKAGIDFEKTLDSMAAKFGEITPEQFLALENAARDVGGTTEFSSIQAAKGLDFLAMAGFTATQAIAALPGVVDLATASKLDLATATDIATDTLGAFNLMSEDSTQLTKNLSRASDVMAATATSANTTVELLFETFKKSAPIATRLGASIETVATLTGTLAGAGIKGGKAGIDLKNIFTRLAAPTKEAAGLMEKLGLSVSDKEGNFRDIIDIFDDLGNAIGDKGAAKQTELLNTLFGNIPLASINVLLQTGTKRLTEFRNELLNSEGAAAKMAAQMRDNVAGQIQSFKSRIESVRISVFKIMGPLISKIVGKLTFLVTGFENFLRVNEKIIRSGLAIFFNKVKDVSLAVLNIIKDLASKFDAVRTGSLFFEKLKGFIGAIIPIIRQIIALVGVWIKKMSDAGVFRVIIELFGQMGDIVTFIVKEIVKFYKLLTKVGAIDFLIQSFTLFVNIIRLLALAIKPIVNIIFMVAKEFYTILEPFFKGFAFLFKGINNIFKLVDKKRAQKLKLDTEFNMGDLNKPKLKIGADGLVTPIIEQNKTEFKKSEIEITVNAPENTKIKKKGPDDSFRVNLNLGKQPLLQPSGW